MTAHAELGASGPRATATAPSRRQGGARDACPPQAPGTHRCMVLACTAEDTTAVDLTRGAVVRLRIDWGDEREPDLSPARRSSTPCGPTTPNATTWPSPRPSP